MALEHYGIESTEIYPQPDFRASRDAEGKWTASRTYKIKRAQWQFHEAKFVKGTAVATFDSSLEAYWAFLRVESVDVEDVEGDIKDVFVSFAGYRDGGDPDEGSEWEISYEMRGVLTEQDIMKHPEIVANVTSSDNLQAFREYIDGKAVVYGSSSNPPTVYDVISVQTQESISTITDPDVTKWFTKVVEGWRTYLAPSIEWTKNTTNKDGLTQAIVDDLGKISVPDGNPLKPSQGTYNWLLVGLSENRTDNDTGDEAITFSATWQLSESGGWDADVYDY